VGTEYADWDITTSSQVFDTWISEEYFKPDDVSDFKYVAIGCTCSDSGTKCGFLFTNEFIGLDSTESVPKFIDLTADDDCYYLDYENGDFYVGNDIYDDCSSDEF
jgi:hypothetical protein